MFRKLYIETHQDVSILFADVVNYTFLTTKLEIKDLVETLHELFQRIDSACLVCNIEYYSFWNMHQLNLHMKHAIVSINI